MCFPYDIRMMNTHKLTITLLTVSMMFGCSRAAVTSPIQASPMEVTIAPSATLAKTIIQTPSATLSATEAIKLPIPTISAAKYQLADWTPERADQLIAVLKKYPDTLSFEERGYLESLYYWSFNFAAFAQAEAEYRFPDAVQATKWRWDRMFNQAQASQSIGEISVRLIMDGLNRGEVQIADLKDWFERNAPNMKLEFISQAPLLDYDSSQIILITPASNSVLGGGTYIWLLGKSSTYTAYSLESPNDFYYGDGEVRIDFQDLTGDMTPEVIIHHVDWGSFNMHYGYLDIFDLSRTPPRRLDLDQEPWDLEVANVKPFKENQKVVGVSMQTPIDVVSGGCGQFGPTWNYHWDGSVFQLSQIQPPTIDELKSDPRCADILIAWYLMPYARQGNQPAIEVMKELVDKFPFEPTEDIENSYRMAHSQDELRFQFGLYLFDQGDIPGAREQMEAIRANSVISASGFAQYAKRFLNEYNSKSDFLHVCLAIHQCSSYFDVAKLVSFVPPSRFSEIINLLKQMGLQVRISGSYDLASNGQKEYFLITDGVIDNFWIFSLSADQIKYSTFDFASYDNIENIHFTFLRNEHGMPVFLATNSDNEAESLVFYYPNKDETQESISEENADHRLKNITDELLSGLIAPETAITQLVELQNTRILCIDASNEWCFPNAGYEYVLGLAYELSNNDILAVETYQHLWKSYPESPYAIMAMSKLEAAP